VHLVSRTQFQSSLLLATDCRYLCIIAMSGLFCSSLFRSVLFPSVIFCSDLFSSMLLFCCVVVFCCVLLCDFLFCVVVLLCCVLLGTRVFCLVYSVLLGALQCVRDMPMEWMVTSAAIWLSARSVLVFVNFLEIPILYLRCQRYGYPLF